MTHDLLQRQPPAWVRGLIVGATGVSLFILENIWRLRDRKREPKSVRTERNLTIASMAGVVVSTVETPLAMWVAQRVEESGSGLMPHLTANTVLRLVGAVILLDYGLYVWHVLTHKVPFLWQFHLVHHVDLDMDTTTAVRFHFGEMLLSVPWRIAQIRVAGASWMAVSVWQTLLFVSILFHHSNLRLPLAVERGLRFLIVTPRLHGIHHRPELSCTDSNWSSGLAIWDLLHGTYCWREDDQDAIGVPGYNKVSQVTLDKCVTLPFRNPDPGFRRSDRNAPYR